MSNPLDKHLQNGFADFEGLHLSGSLPIRQEVLNELLAHLLQHGVPAPTPAPPSALDATLSAPAALKVKPDLNVLLSRVKRASVRFEDGRAVVDFEIGV